MNATTAFAADLHPSRQTRRYRQRRFTLIELLVVMVALTGIATTVATINSRNGIDSNRDAKLNWIVDAQEAVASRDLDEGDGRSWQRLLDVYSPMIRAWLFRNQLQTTDVDDVAQVVLTVVFRRLPEFDRQRAGSFRTWLKQITVNCLRDHWRSQKNRPKATGNSDVMAMLDQLADSASGVSRIWDEEHDRHLMSYLLKQIRDEFRDNTWQAFQMVAMDERPAAEVAKELGITVNAVFIAKSRVLKRMRELGSFMLE